MRWIDLNISCDDHQNRLLQQTNWLHAWNSSSPKANGLFPERRRPLETNQLRTLGLLVDESQAYAESALGNQVPETIELAASARRLGAVAATALGAGFGGSVWALVGSDSAVAFLAEWSSTILSQISRCRAKRPVFSVLRRSRCETHRLTSFNASALHLAMVNPGYGDASPINGPIQQLALQ